jgi:predicted DNA-binding ribbon-helix-helix protein
VLIKRSFSLAGHRTSVALEDAFWRALGEMADREATTLSALVARIDGGRPPETSLASALRVLALQAAHARGTSENSSRDRVID